MIGMRVPLRLLFARSPSLGFRRPVALAEKDRNEFPEPDFQLLLRGSFARILPGGLLDEAAEYLRRRAHFAIDDIEQDFPRGCGEDALARGDMEGFSHPEMLDGFRIPVGSMLSVKVPIHSGEPAAREISLKSLGERLDQPWRQGQMREEVVRVNSCASVTRSESIVSCSK